MIKQIHCSPFLSNTHIFLRGLCQHTHNFIASGRREAARVVAEDGVVRKDMGLREFREISCDM